MRITRNDISQEIRTSFQQLIINQINETSIEEQSNLLCEQIQFIQRNFQIQNQPEITQIFQI